MACSDKSKKRKLGDDALSINKRSCPESINSDNFLEGCQIFILNAGIENARLQIFKAQTVKYGGLVSENMSGEVTHIVVSDNMEVDRMCRLMKIDQQTHEIPIIKSAWLSSCFREKRCIDINGYEVNVSIHLSKQKDTINEIEVHINSQGRENKTTNSITNKPEITHPKYPTTETMKSEYPKVGVMWKAFKKQETDLNSDISNKCDKHGSDSDYMPSDEEESSKQKTHAASDDQDRYTGISNLSKSATPQPTDHRLKSLPKTHWTCFHSSKNPLPNYNKHITDKLEEMVKTYESTNDRWRAFGYQKAIQILRKQPKEITTWEEARDLPAIGTRLADKIWEIIESGGLRKLDAFKSSEEVCVINLFADVWGAGPHTARMWYQMGLRTLEDLKTKANLTKQQKIGLTHYYDFLDRMPREEAGEIEQTVREVAAQLITGTLAVVCGSYRRGKATCGDVDILITHPDGKSHRHIFSPLLAELHLRGLLTDDLVSAEESGNQKKYMGVFKLPGNDKKHRRIDIIVVPFEEYACALVHFTGSAHFNRSMRHLAKRMNMSLSEHALREGVVRKGGEKLYEGNILDTPTEESIFKHLGIPNRPPEERDH